MPDEYYSYVFIIIHILNASSTILATVTVYLYFWLPNVQDIHGTCIFHYSLNIAILHAMALYYWTTDSGILPETVCFIEIDVVIFVLTAVNTWSIILSYNTWKQIPRPGLVTINPRRRLNYYRLIGYGVPLLYQLLIIRLHLSMPDEYGQFLTCLITFLMASVFPFSSSSIMNVIYFVGSQRRLGNMLSRIAASENASPEDKIILKRLTYKFRLNLKLCTTMNIPFSISLIINLVIQKEFTRLMMVMLASVHGTLIFLVAVAFRKRVIKGFVRHGDKFCVGCIRPAIQGVLKAEDDGDGTDCEEASCAEEDRAAAAPRNHPI